MSTYYYERNVTSCHLVNIKKPIVKYQHSPIRFDAGYVMALLST